jgi:L-serine deaminase
MESIKELYKIGPGPSSSHTIGPQKIMEYIKEKYSDIDRCEVVLYGSLSLTGRGHLTDYIIEKTMGKIETKIIFSKEELKYHPNGMEVFIYNNNVLLAKERAFSIGGGSFFIEGEQQKTINSVYKHQQLTDIYQYLNEHEIDLYEYIIESEDLDFYQYLKEIWQAMKDSIENGLNDQGLIPGKLKLSKVAKDLYNLAVKEENIIEQQRLFITSYAYAVSEQNASGQLVVTAPTCGASGVIPAILYYSFKHLGYLEKEIIKALAVGGLIGNLIKTNATISGAKGGCQAEIGSACSMGSAAYAYLMGLSLSQIEYAAEMGLEHFAGLTCDPIGGYVQIPCIERNGFGALRVLSVVSFAKNLGSLRKHLVSFDSMVRVMKNIGEDMKVDYRETSIGGLASEYPLIYKEERK